MAGKIIRYRTRGIPPEPIIALPQAETSAICDDLRVRSSALPTVTKLTSKKL